jgi:hypothetical protein
VGKSGQRPLRSSPLTQDFLPLSPTEEDPGKYLTIRAFALRSSLYLSPPRYKENDQGALNATLAAVMEFTSIRLS